LDPNHQRQAERLACINIFLNWFKLNMYLEFIPQFSLLFRTFRNASGPMGSFAVVFFISFLGFAFSHTILFHHSVYHFRDLNNGQLGLLRLLLGDLDADAMIEADPIMGPVLYICFTTFCVLVIFNILISILMDAYERAMVETNKMPKLNIWESFFRWMRYRIVPCWDHIFGQSHNDKMHIAAETIQAFWRVNHWSVGAHMKSAKPVSGDGAGTGADVAPTLMGELRSLCEMKAAGHLTEVEFASCKAHLLETSGVDQLQALYDGGLPPGRKKSRSGTAGGITKKVAVHRAAMHFTRRTGPKK
jgi:hypothetical protein